MSVSELAVREPDPEQPGGWDSAGGSQRGFGTRPLFGVAPIPRSAPPALTWRGFEPRAGKADHPELPWSSELASSARRSALAKQTVSDASPHRRDQPASEPDGGRDGRQSRPDPQAWSGWLAQLIVEVVHGRRPAGQLARWTEEAVQATVLFRARQLRTGAARGRAAPDRARVNLGSVRVQQPTVNCVEASVVIRGARATALAFRLEAHGNRWLCTAIDFGPQTPQPG